MEPFGDLGPARIVAIALITIGAGVVKGAIGFGFQLLAAPLLSMVWDVRHAVPLQSLTALTNNVGSVFGLMASGAASRATTRRLAPVFVGLVGGTVGGALLLATLDPTVLGLTIGLRPQDRIDPELFRRLVVAAIALNGLSLLARAIWR